MIARLPDRDILRLKSNDEPILTKKEQNRV